MFDQVDSDKRATVESFFSLITTFAEALGFFSPGYSQMERLMKNLIDVVPTQSQSKTLLALENLVIKKKITLARMSREDMLVILALASLCLPVAVEFTETEANQALKRWLEEDGSMLRIDHVELRRTLIDLCFWIRDGYGHAYWRPLLRQDHIGYKHIEVLQTINVTQFVEEARAREDDLRAKRKVMHTQGGRSNPTTGLEVESGRCPD